MRRIIYLATILLFATNFVYAQNYYVAFVKGQVYYKKKLLKKRDKVKMKGKIKFTSSSDYVRLSGPGGLYTLGPGQETSTGNEFLVAVREELFPRVRPYATTADNIIIFSDNYFGLSGFRYSYLENDRLGKAPPLKEGEELGYLHETSDGLIYREAVIRDSQLIVRQADFTFQESDAPAPVLNQTAIVLVRDKEAWQELLSGKDSIAQIQDSVSRFGYDDEPVYIEQVDKTSGEVVLQESYPPAEILDYMGPPRFINRRKLAKDLRFHLRRSDAPNIETFLEDFYYEEYIDDKYGYLQRSSLYSVLREDLGLPSQFD